MTGSFKRNNPSNHFFLILYGLMLYWPIFMHPAPALRGSDETLLYQQLLDVLTWIFGKHLLEFPILIFLLTYMQSLVLNHIASTQRLFQRPNFLVGMCYWLFSAAFFQEQGFGPVVLMITLMVWVLHQVNHFQTTQTPGRTLYNTGLLLGVALLLDHTSFVFIFLPMIGLTIMRPFRLQEWFIALLGVLTPIYLQVGGMFIKYGHLQQLELDLKFEWPDWNLSLMENMHLALLLLVTLIGFFYVQSNRMKELVQARNSWSVMLATGLLSMFFLLFDGEETHRSLSVLMPVMAFFGAAAFYYVDRGWFRTLMHLALLGMAMTQGFFFAFR